jgi:hypothetical protein
MLGPQFRRVEPAKNLLSDFGGRLRGIAIRFLGADGKMDGQCQTISAGNRLRHRRQR